MNLKILSIGSDRNLFKKESDAQKRIRDYGKLFDELHIIVFADKKLGFSDLKLDGNIFIYPTNHSYKIFYLWNITKIVKRIILNSSFAIHDLIITCQDPFESGFAGWLLKLWLKIPLQLQIHTDIFSPYFSAESFANKLRVFLAKFLLPRADAIRVVSERIKHSIASNVKGQLSNVSTLPVFVDIKKIQSAKIKINLHEKYPEFNFIILMASRLTREKNIGMAIEALKKLKVQSEKLKVLLLVVGDGPERGALQKLIVKCQLSNVVIEPWTNDLISYYKTADLFLLTSNYEGYGRTVVEAMSAGLPVIMTDVGLAGGILIDDLDGLVVPVGDQKYLADVLAELIRDNEKRHNFSENSLKVAGSLPNKNDYLDSYKRSFTI